MSTPPPFAQRPYAKWVIAFLIALFAFLIIQSVRYLWRQSKVADVFAVVPANAIAVLELPDVAATWQQAQTTNLWQGLQETPYFKDVQTDLAALFGLPRHGRLLRDYLAGKKVYVSLHTTGRADLGYVFYLPVDADDPALAQQMLAEAQTVGQLTTETREYQSRQVHELAHAASGRRLSYLFHKNYWVASFAPFLIDDVVRNVGELGRENFHRLNAPAVEAAASPDAPRVYVNVRRLPELATAFFGQPMPGLGGWAGCLQMQAELKGPLWRFQGEAFAESHRDQPEWLKTWADQAPTPHDSLLHLLPEQTATLLRLGITNGEKWLKVQEAYRAGAGAEPAAQTAFVLEEQGLNVEGFFEEINGEVAALTLEATDDTPPDQIVLVRAKQPKRVQLLLNRLAENAVAARKDTVYYESYGFRRVTRIDVPELPRHLFGPNFSGFAACHQMFWNDFLVLGNSFRAIKNWAGQIEAELTWGRSAKLKGFVDNLGPSSNVLMVASNPRYWRSLQPQLLPARQAQAAAYQRQLLRIELAGWQVSQQKGRFLVNAALSHRQVRAANAKALVPVYTAQLATPAATGPQLFRSHVDRSWEVLLQDQGNTLALFSQDGKRRWATPIGGKMQGPAWQIDIYNNQKLQFLFATSGGIYLVDRLGRLVPGFPITYSWAAPLQKLGLIDYEKTKYYRFAAADAQGNVYLFAKEGNVLAGWNPRTQLHELAMPPFHIRTGGRDCIVAVQADGGLYVCQRNSQNHAGFPLKLSDNLASPAYLQEGPDFASTRLVLLSQRGDLIKVNFNGQVVEREPFGPDGYFQLCPDQVGQRGWVIARQQGERLTIFNQQGQPLFNHPWPDAALKNVQYFNFGTNLALVAVTDPTSKTVRLFYPNGDEATPKPLPNQQPVAIIYNDMAEEFEIYTTSGLELQKWKLGRD